MAHLVEKLKIENSENLSERNVSLLGYEVEVPRASTSAKAPARQV